MKSDALAFIDRNQLARRNLTPEQRALLIGRLYQELKQPHGGSLPKDPNRQIVDSKGNRTSTQLAETFQVSHRSVERAAAFTEALEFLQQVSPAAAQRVLQGEVGNVLR